VKQSSFVKIFAVVRETLQGPFSAVHYPFP